MENKMSNEKPGESLVEFELRTLQRLHTELFNEHEELKSELEEIRDKYISLKEDVYEDRVKPDDYLYLATVNTSLKSELELAKAEIERLKDKIELQRENSIASSLHHEANFGHLKNHYESEIAKLKEELKRLKP